MTKLECLPKVSVHRVILILYNCLAKVSIQKCLTQSVLQECHPTSVFFKGVVLRLPCKSV